MDWDEVVESVFDAYGRGAYGDGLVVIPEARLQFPDSDTILTFWEACLSSKEGQPEHALEALRSGLERGLAWHPKMLADPDLDQTRELEGWDQLQERSARALSRSNMEHPGTLVRLADAPVGTLVALHGAGTVPEEFFDEWENATPTGWTLIVPIGDVPRPPDRWAWPYDLATDSLVEALQDQPLNKPIALAGFSQGAAMASKAAWNGLYAVSGLILFAGTLEVAAWRASDQRPVPLFAVIGTDDGISYESCLATCEALEADGVPVLLDIRDGLGHDQPPDLDVVIQRGLAWIQEQNCS